jgi:hypothetical protein
MFRPASVRLATAAVSAGILLLASTAAAAAASSWVLVTDGTPVLAPPAPPAVAGPPAPTPQLHTFEVRVAPGHAGAARPSARVRARAQGRALALAAPATSPGPCSDKKYSFGTGSAHARWQETFEWSYRARTTPDNLSSAAVIKVLKRSVRNIVNANNDCGHPDKVGATAVYLGTTDRTPAPTDKGTCAPQDDHNVIGFGKLPGGIAGLTCVWSVGDRIIEADIKLDRRASWATSLLSCDIQSMVEAVATHEFGHAFGLGHVAESTHGRLTMSERLDGYCQVAEATLGKGDWLGLEALY